MTIDARVSSGRKREAEADAAFRTVKMARSVGPDRGRKAHDKERQVIEKTKTDNKKRRARSISLRAENLRLKEELRRMSVRGEDLLELWRQLETALQTLDKKGEEIKKLKADLARSAKSVSLHAENLRLKEELRRMSVRSEDLLELWQQLETARQTLDKKEEEIKQLKADLAYGKDDLREARCTLSEVTDGANLAATTLWQARQLDRISDGSKSRMGRRLWRAFEDWRRDHGSEDDSRSER